ncbi:MAG: quinol:cytochrome C oxidoreductase [Acidobacteria bacterium RIFCSPHIGHO2_01_FULL_67_28]|nr:MAG: quinol:cytochrome C oxidoreductase [Acidobacteria bacterium RIFCSPHIGHO2_01_FULL_67_28]
MKSNTKSQRGRRGLVWLALAAVVWLAACRQDMFDQPRTRPLRRSEFFGDGRSARPPVAGSVARGQLHDDPHLYTGRVNGALVTTFPFPVSREVLERGHERYNIFCAPCHDRVGNGNGMVVRRGFRAPPSFHIDRLRAAPAGHYFDVITNGFGAMPDYAAQIPAHDRWAIIAYIRALQLSQRAAPADVPTDVLKQLPEAAQ